MDEEQIKIQQRQHQEIITQMRIDTGISMLVAAAQITTVFIIFVNLVKHVKQ